MDRWKSVKPGEEKLQDDLTVDSQYLKGARKRNNGQGHVVIGHREMALKLKEGRFRLGIKTKFLTLRVVSYRHRLSREVVGASSLEVFSTRVDEALSNLI